MLFEKRKNRKFNRYFGWSVLLLCVFMLAAPVTARAQESRIRMEQSPMPDAYDEFADTVLDSIITQDMTDEEKCMAVYDYVHAIPYVNIVYSDDWKENGYWMLHDRKGDCFGFYSASRLLLERLGYQVIELQNINGFTHVWCLVSIDNGQTWRHFDPTCWSWGSDGYLCLLTDEELIEYGMRHQVGYGQLSHDWDREQAAEDIRVCQEQQENRVHIIFQEEDFAEPDSGSSVVARRTLIESEPQG